MCPTHARALRKRHHAIDPRALLTRQVGRNVWTRQHSCTQRAQAWVVGGNAWVLRLEEEVHAVEDKDIGEGERCETRRAQSCGGDIP